MPKVSEAYKDRQRTEILDAARRCFVRNGFHRTSMQDVFAEADRSAGAVYRYFPKKDDMIVAVAGQNLDDIAAALRDALTTTDGTPPGPGEVMAQVLDVALRLEAERGLATVALMVWSEALRNPELEHRLRAAVTGVRDELTALIAAQPCTTTGSGEADPTPHDLAVTLTSLLPGLLFGIRFLDAGDVSGVPGVVRTYV